VEKKLLGYHFRTHPKLDLHHIKKISEFQPKIFYKPSNIDGALIKGRRGSVYRQQEQIPTSRFQGHSGGDGRTVLQ
jgi:hypothetical protein